MNMNTQNVNQLKNELTGALIGLANACGNNPSTENTNVLILKGLIATIPISNLTAEELSSLISEVREDKFTVVPNCRYCESPCGNTSDYDMQKLLEEDESIQSLKQLIILMLRGIAANVYPAFLAGQYDNEIFDYLFRGLSFISFRLNSNTLSDFILEGANITLKSLK